MDKRLKAVQVSTSVVFGKALISMTREAQCMQLKGRDSVREEYWVNKTHAPVAPLHKRLGCQIVTKHAHICMSELHYELCQSCVKVQVVLSVAFTVCSLSQMTMNKSHTCI